MGTLQNISESAGEQSHIIYLNYLDAEKVSKALENTQVSVVPVEGQNAIMVYTNTDTFEGINNLVKSMDVPQKNIEISVRLIVINITDSK